MMRYIAVDAKTGTPVHISRDKRDSHVKFWFLPRILCLNCPDKLYAPGPEKGVTNFEIHLRSPNHRDRVADRIAQTKVIATSAPTFINTNANAPPNLIPA